MLTSQKLLMNLQGTCQESLEVTRTESDGWFDSDSCPKLGSARGQHLPFHSSQPRGITFLPLTYRK